MELEEAIVTLFGPRSLGDNKAYPIVASFLERCASRSGARDSEDIAQNVLSRLLTRTRGGDTPWTHPAAAKAYLAKCAERAAIDEHRREQRESRLQTDLSPQQPPVLDGDQLTLVEKAAVVARTLRAPRYRLEFDATWSQLSALVFDGADLRELLLAAGAIHPGYSDAEFIQARNRAYKNHERVRKGILTAVTKMRDSGQLSTEDAALALDSLRILVRCQRSEPRSVSRSKKGGS